MNLENGVSRSILPQNSEFLTPTDVFAAAVWLSVSAAGALRVKMSSVMGIIDTLFINMMATVSKRYVLA